MLQVDSADSPDHWRAGLCPESAPARAFKGMHNFSITQFSNVPKIDTVFVRISVTFSTLHSFISVKKIFDEHVYLTQNAHEP
jgi:hypothetical protein